MTKIARMAVFPQHTVPHEAIRAITPLGYCRAIIVDTYYRNELVMLQYGVGLQLDQNTLFDNHASYSK